MHPITSLFLAGDHIADLHRDADRRRLASNATRPGRATVHHHPTPPRPAVHGVGAGAGLSEESGAG
jgi:hypothetical protein